MWLEKGVSQCGEVSVVRKRCQSVWRGKGVSQCGEGEMSVSVVRKVSVSVVRKRCQSVWLERCQSVWLKRDVCQCGEGEVSTNGSLKGGLDRPVTIRHEFSVI